MSTRRASPGPPWVGKAIGYALLGGFAFLVASILDTDKHQNWALTVPYLSGAANYELGQGWRYAESDIAIIADLPSDEARERYRLEPSEDLRPYDLSNKGFLFVALIARSIFFWQGDVQAVENLQILVHVLVSLAMIALLRSTTSRTLFFVFYTLNPVILLVTTLPYYYFWQVLPSAFLLPMLWDREFRYGPWALAVAALLAALYVVRPTMLFPSLFCLSLIFLRESKALGAAALAVYLVLAFPVFQGNAGKKDPWHTAYIGLGGYPNPYVSTFADEEAVGLYEEKHGVRVYTGADGNYRDPEVRAEMSALSRGAYLEIARKEPLMLVRNAALNFFESYSVGYVAASLTLTYISAALGVVVLGTLLVCGEIPFAIAIGISTIATVPIAPPNHLYMFSNYLLLFGAFLHLARRFGVTGRIDAFLAARLPEIP